MLYQGTLMTSILVNLLPHFCSFAHFPFIWNVFSQISYFNIDFLPKATPAPGRHSHGQSSSKLGKTSGIFLDINHHLTDKMEAQRDQATFAHYSQ